MKRKNGISQAIAVIVVGILFVVVLNSIGLHPMATLMFGTTFLLGVTFMLPLRNSLFPLGVVLATLGSGVLCYSLTLAILLLLGESPLMALVFTLIFLGGECLGNIISRFLPRT